MPREPRTLIEIPREELVRISGILLRTGYRLEITNQRLEGDLIITAQRCRGSEGLNSVARSLLSAHQNYEVYRLGKELGVQVHAPPSTPCT